MATTHRVVTCAITCSQDFCFVAKATSHPLRAPALPAISKGLRLNSRELHTCYICMQQHIRAKEASACQPASSPSPVMARFSIWVYGTSFQSPSSVAGSHTNRHNYFIQPSFPSTESCKRGGSRGHACLEHQTLVRYPSSHCRSLSRSGTLQCARLFRS
jgi:hypothetical protein